MAITDPAAIRFCNEQFRPAADRIARCFYRAHELRDLWSATTGTNDEKFAILQPKIRSVATLISNTFRFVWWADRLWQSGTLAALFPNDSNEILFDNSNGTGPDLTRSQVNGQDLRRLKNRMEEFGNHLSRGTDLLKAWDNDSVVNNVASPVIYGYFDDVARMAGDGANVPVTNWGRIVAADRCGDIVTRYETDSPSSLSQILKVAVNPQSSDPV